MPAASAKQKKFMDAAAHNPAFAKKAGVPVKVAKEFSKASKGQTFKEGGEMKDSKAMVKKEIGFMKAKGAPKSMMKHEMAEMKGMKKGEETKKFGMGGALKRIAQQVAPAVKAAAIKASPAMKSSVSGAVSRAAPAIKRLLGRGMAEGGNVTKMGAVKTAKPTSGSASSRADGIAQKGKTKGKMLQKGGKC